MTTTPGDDVLHVTESRALVLPSLNVPTAENCWRSPTRIDARAEVTVSDSSSAGVTAIAAVPLTEPELAVTLKLPADTAVNTPEGKIVPPEGLTLQTTDLVMSRCVLSVYVPVAEKFALRPKGTDFVAVETASETSEGGVTVRLALVICDLRIAEIVAAPGAVETAVPERSSVATPNGVTCQLTIPVTSFVVPSLNFAVTLN
jgi:hypothetical protein